MDVSKILRAVDQMNLRVKRLEEAVAGFAPPVVEMQDLYHDRSKVDLDLLMTYIASGGQEYELQQTKYKLVVKSHCTRPLPKRRFY